MDSITYNDDCDGDGDGDRNVNRNGNVNIQWVISKALL